MLGDAEVKRASVGERVHLDRSQVGPARVCQPNTCMSQAHTLASTSVSNRNGNLNQIVVNVNAIYKGKTPDITYLVPGDQVFVPGNKLKSIQKIMSLVPILSFARIFTGGIL